jgi:glycerol-3-phosphate acyltransferase PlsY
MTPYKFILAALSAYLIGSIPTALLYSRIVSHVDIRELGDGNMGARNIKHNFGWRAGILVFLIDFTKGALAVLLATVFSMPELGNYACGALAILGHDFPVFARFKGGQGFAVTTGVFLGLFPAFTLFGALIYFGVYLVTRNSDLGGSLGMGFITGAQWLSGGTTASIAFIVIVLLFIPFKKWLDRSRRKEIQNLAQQKPQVS